MSHLLCPFLNSGQSNTMGTHGARTVEWIESGHCPLSIALLLLIHPFGTVLLHAHELTSTYTHTHTACRRREATEIT